MPRTDRRPRTRQDPAVRRAEILAVAAVLFGVRPYPDVAVTAIAERVGVSEALVLRYFGTKAELYTAVVEAALGVGVAPVGAEVAGGDRAGHVAANGPRAPYMPRR